MAIHLKKSFLDAISTSPELRQRIAVVHNKSEHTVGTWARNNNVMLTTIQTLEVMKKYFGLENTDDFLEEDIKQVEAA